MIINAIVDMGGSATPSLITDYILKKKKVQMERNRPDLSYEVKARLTKRNAISLRAVKGHLDSLLSEGLITKSKGGVYSINDSADYRYFGRRFGRATLFLLMKAYDCRHDLEGNTEALISIFGTHVLYSFLEACKAYKLTDRAADDDMVSTVAKRTYSWVQDFLNPSDMFAYFLEIMHFHFNRHFAAEVYKKSINQSSNEDGLEMDRIADEDDYLYIPIDDKMIDRMLKIISKKYPEYYERLNTARQRIQLEIKHGCLDRRSGGG